MNIFSLLITHLTILQQEGYEPGRFLSWWVTHPFKYQISHKKPLVYTSKVKKIIFLSLTLALIQSIILLPNFFNTLIPGFLLLLLPPPFLIASLFLLWPYEAINRRHTINTTRQTLLSHPHLKTIGITGSFGKTSVKDYLYQILASYTLTLKTPQSYNTIFGIAKVVKLELLSKHHFFISEMGAYKRGEIKELCFMTPPQFSILTAIGTQHLERFKTLENTTLAKFEIIDSNPNKENCLVNLDNPYIKNTFSQAKYKNIKTYSLHDPKADFRVSHYTLKPSGTTFTISYKNNHYSFTSPLFGTSNLENLTAAISMSLMLKLPITTIKKAVSSITPAPHRLELKKIGNCTLIDNSFSSNETGFHRILDDLSDIPGKKALITPGIIELGDKTATVHQEIGEKASKIFEKIILVGESERTKNLQIGLGGKNSTHIPNNTNLWPIIHELAESYDWILLENDLPDTF